MSDHPFPPVPALRLAMTMLGTRDLDAAIAFYAGTLGLPQTGRVADFAFFDVGGGTICLTGEKRKHGDPDVDGSVELVLGVDSVAAAYEALRARGVAFITEPHAIGGEKHVAHFRDPDGHLFSLYGAE